MRFIIPFFIFSLTIVQTGFSKPMTKAETDSVKKVAVIRRHILADSLRRNAVTVVYSLGYADTLLEQIDHLHATLNKITNQSKYGFKTQQIEDQLQDMQRGIKVIDQSLGRDSTVLNIGNLQMFRGLLKDMETKLGEWKASLYKNNTELAAMAQEMKDFQKDSFPQKVAADTAFANLHLDELLILRDKWREAKSSTNNNLKHISAVMANVSTTYFSVTEMENIVNNQLASAGGRTISQEYNFIWNTRTTSKFNETMNVTWQSYSERMQILAYYLRLNVWDWLTIIIMGLIFFIWIYRNNRKIKLTAQTTPIDLSLVYIRPIPILSTLLFILNFAPFYNFDQPGIYIEVVLLLILIPLTIVFARLWKGTLFFDWCLLVGLCILTSVMGAIITPGWPLRYYMIAINIASILWGWRFFKEYTKTLPLGRTVKWTTILLIVLQAAALIANVCGRVTLGKILTSASIKGLTEMISLFVMVQILTEAFYLQMQSSRISGGMDSAFEFDNIRSGLYRLLAMGAVFLWLIGFTTNLDIYGALLDFLDWILNTQRKIGSTSFTIGNILTFVFVLYVVNVLQQYIGYFFGESDDDSSSDPDKNQSRLVIFRLIIIMAGFFIAVVASGLPVDKVTVVLGALGVGIGLGLQNIVYNLVSGIVLVFEKPMQVGDYIEVADKKGRVQSIGIRSSTLRTSEGSEVIVPNGDFLSTHMVNWTRSNDNRRTELTMEIEPASEMQTAKDTIQEELKANVLVIHERPVEILLSNLTEKSVTLTVYVWINSIYKEQEFKSEIVSHIYSKLAEKGIKII